MFPFWGGSASQQHEDTASDSSSSESDNGPLTNVQKADKIMAKIKTYRNFTFGDFLETLLNSSDKINGSSKQALTQWLSGNTRKGTRPAEIVDSMYRNPHSYTHINHQLQTAAFDSLAVPETATSNRSASSVSFLPDSNDLPRSRNDQKPLFNSREGLEEWAARLVLWFVNREASSLEKELAPATAPTWSQIEEFSLQKERPIMRAKAPILWAVLCAVALNKRCLARKLGGQRSSTSELSSSSSGSSNDSRSVSNGSEREVGDPLERTRRKANEQAELAATVVIYILIGFRNKMVGFFRSFTGIALFASNVQKTVFHILSRIRFSRAYSSVHRYLTKLAFSAKEDLRTLGKRAFESLDDNCEDPQFFYFIFDNINKYVIPRQETVGNKSSMRNGTAATAIVMEDAPKGAFLREPYIKRLEERLRQNLTVDMLYNDIDPEHRACVGAATVMRILTRNIVELKGLQRAVDKLFEDTNHCAIHRLRLRKTRMHTLGTSGINEATTDGASNVVDDLAGQTGMELSWFDNLLMFIGGDQLTVDRIRKAIYNLDQEEIIYYSKSWALPIIQPWHMGWAYLKSLVRTHWFESTGKETLGFRHAVGVLGRNSNLTEYYPLEDAVVTVFDTMVLSAARTTLRKSQGSVQRPNDGMKELQLLEELELYFNQDSGRCNMDYLHSLAVMVYDEYMTTDAYLAALSGPSSDSQPTQSEIEDFLTQNFQAEQTQAELELTPSKRTVQARKTTAATQAQKYITSILRSDHVQANCRLFMSDALEFVEFTSAMKEGDTGRLFKVIDAFRFAFWGSGSTNYGSELLELACNMKFEYPEPLKEAFMNNYLVNPSGFRGRWQAGDFLQEHFNKDIKTIFNLKNSDFDSKFMRESISLNIAGFSYIKELFLELLQLARTGKRRAVAQRRQDINVLGSHFEEESFFDLIPGRSQPYHASDIIAAGRTRLEEGALESFLSCTLCDPSAVQEDTNVPDILDGLDLHTDG